MSDIPYHFDDPQHVENITSGSESAGMSVPETQSEAPVTMTAEEEAAMKFTRLLPFVNKLADAMPSKGGLVRVLTSLAEFPLGGRQPRLLNDAERQLFQVMQELHGYKTTVIASFMRKQTELEQAQQTATKDVAETELSNGGN